MNILIDETFEPISTLLRVLGHPIRIRILKEIGSGEACVCHLVSKLGIRQAYLSQQLMALRMEGILNTHREGRFVYYRIADKKVLDLVATAAEMKGVTISTENVENIHCNCPKCSKEG
jgi:DNA-binding transcriptional ArsR family regulator